MVDVQTEAVNDLQIKRYLRRSLLGAFLPGGSNKSGVWWGSLVGLLREWGPVCGPLIQLGWGEYVMGVADCSPT